MLKTLVAEAPTVGSSESKYRKVSLRNVGDIIKRPFYQYSGHIELIRFKEYYRMPGGLSTFRLYF